ncbi:hypothetical protein GW17_00045291 [Ensete ventricosum]|nr:hypothetical protein GW17_00045291 [Ensete ventricosum]
MGKAAARTIGVLLFLLGSLFSDVKVEAQMPIPAKIDGFVYKGALVWGKSVVVEAFFDPLCPDSRDSWPPLKQALLHYPDRISVVEGYYDEQTYNLTRASVVGGIAKLAVAAVGKHSLSSFLSGFDDPATDSATRISFKVSVPINRNIVFFPFFNMIYYVSTTIQYGCSRAVTGTPYFFVNGVPLSQSGSALGYKKWRSILDPLLEKRN